MLAEDEKSLGVNRGDMGGATTSFAIFQDNHLVMADVVPVGGQHITNDIGARPLDPIAHAERMKTLWAPLWQVRSTARDDLGSVAGRARCRHGAAVPKSMLTGIIRPRLEETFEMLRAKLEAAGAQHLAGRRLVITGGASQLNGCARGRNRMARHAGAHGFPGPCPGYAGKRPFPGFAVCAGMLNYALMPDIHYALPKAKAEQVARAQSGYVWRMGRWIERASDPR